MLGIFLLPTAVTAVYAIDLYAQLLPLRPPRSRAARFSWTLTATASRLLAHAGYVLRSTKLDRVFCCWLRVRLLRGLHWACTVFCLLHPCFDDKEQPIFLLEHVTRGQNYAAFTNTRHFPARFDSGTAACILPGCLYINALPGAAS